ncbi:MAG: DM13 domain-containing protein [Cyclobacteriaceae bacterium]
MKTSVIKSLLYFVFAAFLIACGDDIAKELDEDIDLTQPIVYNGDFNSANSYNVSGKAFITMEEGKKMLIFQDFMSTSGPDLKVYLSAEKSPKNHLDLGDLKALSGNFSYELPIDYSLSENGPFVLVYCEQFTVLFGSAELMMNEN